MSLKELNQRILDAFDLSDGLGAWFAELVISTYRRGNNVDMFEVIRLDAYHHQLMIDILSYRCFPGWSDDEYWELEKAALACLRNNQ